MADGAWVSVAGGLVIGKILRYVSLDRKVQTPLRWVIDEKPNVFDHFALADPCVETNPKRKATLAEYG